MSKKLFVSLFMLAFVLAGAAAMPVAAQTSPFPAGCSSGMGYSITTGTPCNGTNTATTSLMAGCTSTLGYSTTNGAPCSGGTVALQFLAGCTSTAGYSTIDGDPCNGTNVATPVVSPTPTPTTPGLPTTGFGGNAASNIALITLFSAVFIGGTIYFVRRYRLESNA